MGRKWGAASEPPGREREEQRNTVPIRSEFRHLYGPEWKRISQAAVVRAGFRCQRCGLPNYAYIRRQAEGPPVILDPGQAELAMREGLAVTKIVLTVAHLDQDPTNNAPENLAALCQACHLAHDRQQHIRNARQTRTARKDAQRPLLRLIAAQGQDSTPAQTARRRRPRTIRGSLKRMPTEAGGSWYAYWNEDGRRRGRKIGECDRMNRHQAEAALAAIVEPINAKHKESL